MKAANSLCREVGVTILGPRPALTATLKLENPTSALLLAAFCVGSPRFSCELLYSRKPSLLRRPHSA